MFVATQTSKKPARDLELDELMVVGRSPKTTCAYLLYLRQEDSSQALRWRKVSAAT